MHSSYQVTETRHADLSLSVHERIEDLNHRARTLAPAVAESALDSGCTDLTRREHGNLGPRQVRAWDLIAEAYAWNAICDDPEALAQAERYEREGTAYRVDLVSTDSAERPMRVVPVVAEPARPKPTEQVTTSELRVGDIVVTHGMRVRIDAVTPYTPGDGRCGVCHRDAHRRGWQGHYYEPQVAWSCPGTVLNLDEVLAAGIVPPSFLTREEWVEGTGWTVVRRDAWSIQGNDLARWTRASRDDPEPVPPGPGTGCTELTEGLPGAVCDLEREAGEAEARRAYGTRDARRPGRARPRAVHHRRPGGMRCSA